MKQTLILFLLLSAFTLYSQEDYSDFYAKREASLKSETGWLNLAGLFWLKEGENTIGGAESNDFVFPHAEASLGKVILQNNQVTYNGQVIFTMEGKSTVMNHQSLRWFIIKCGDKYAIRLRDLEGEYLKAFHGIDHFPASSKWKVNAKFIPTVGKKVAIIDITGRSYQEDSPCAFTPFATCPLPTKENKLPIAIPAGEKNAGHH